MVDQTKKSKRFILRRESMIPKGRTFSKCKEKGHNKHECRSRSNLNFNSQKILLFKLKTILVLQLSKPIVLYFQSSLFRIFKFSVFVNPNLLIILLVLWSLQFSYKFHYFVFYFFKKLLNVTTRW